MRLVRTLIVAFAMVGSSAGFVYAAGTDLEDQIGTASTPEQHQALADHFTAQATEARDKADRHRRMADRYARGKSVLDQSGHCVSLANRYEANAKDYDALAAAEAAEAKK